MDGESVEKGVENNGKPCSGVGINVQQACLGIGRFSVDFSQHWLVFMV